MPSITPIGTTSELAAVNRLLSAVGEAPISDLASSTREDVLLAVNLLKEASMEVQSLRWRFNTEWGYELSPAGTLPWVGTDGSAETLNVFTPPAGLIDFRLTSTAKQGDLDVILRISRQFEVAAAKVMVFYDREKNRDGFKQSDFPRLYIDPVWAFEWANLPEAARRYIACRAGRQFVQQTLGAADIAGFAESDEIRTLYALQRQEGIEEDVSMLDNFDVGRVRGFRPSTGFGVVDFRASPGPQ
jgi:hypothetical protein